MTETTDFSARLPEGPLAVAVSGGVDSLCALLLSLRTGRRVMALHARLCEHAGSAARAAAEETELRLRGICANLGAEFLVLDGRERFDREVVQPFARAYAEGRTPNPCALCNRRIKFGAFWEFAAAHGAAGLVTGHYVALDCSHPYRGTAPLLGAARDVRKDQSYFLGLVPRERLARTAFPLACLEKPEVRALVADAGLEVPQPKESQEICFVPPSHQGYRDFLTRCWSAQGLKTPEGGSIVEADSGRTVGRHSGLWQYTEGQRQGLGIPWREPLYVLAKRTTDNVLVVGTRSRTRVTEALLGSLNLMVEPDEIPADCLVRLRYRQHPVPASVRFEGEGLRVICAEPVLLSAPGQIGMVLDRASRVLACGIIESMA
ncbi:MAG: tRNA 2-thiouridine(34) synthase MnmA [Desulfovibrionaceae bacterium]|nr:tRNA 2-thiouridine(34) synthase MnmA [Desulfovibrionaceae bacterium]